MRHIVFLIAYIYFLYNDLREKKIHIASLVLYGLSALIVLGLSRNEIEGQRFVDLVFSVLFGLVIYFLSYFSEEGIGLADGMYFVINGLLLSLKENIVLFLSGLLVAFFVGVFGYFFGKHKFSEDTRLPFMPCFLPVIIGYILCTV